MWAMRVKAYAFRPLTWRAACTGHANYAEEVAKDRASALSHAPLGLAKACKQNNACNKKDEHE